MGRPIASYLFYPVEDGGLVRERFAEIHRTRLGILLPFLALIGVIELGVDVLKLVRAEEVFAFRWYLGFDLGFLAFQLGAWLFFRTAERADGRALFLYLFLVLAWAALVSAVELYRSGNVIAIIIAVMAVSVLVHYSFFVFCALALSPIGTFLAACFLIPGLSPPPVEKTVFLFALALISTGASRALFSASVENILATVRLRRANRELQAMQLQLIQKEKFAALGQLSAGIAHEINNPLGFLRSNFSTLEQGFRYLRSAAPPRSGDAVARHFLDGLDGLFQDTREGFRRISEVIENLRSFSYELPEGSFAPYDLVRGVEGTLVIARNRYKNVARIERNLAPVPDIQARGSEINQVLLNLLLNAVTAVASAGPDRDRVISVSTREKESSVVFEISDTGPGVPEELKRRIFDPFFTTKPVGEGFGLGLSLCWEIVVNRHKGGLDLLDGKPTTFRVILPIRRPAEAGGGPSSPGVDPARSLG
jgi:signal transduction histidine kinase